MRRTIWLAAACLAFAGPLAGAAGRESAGPLEGVWRNQQNTVHVRVASCGVNVCGTVVAARGQAIEDGRKSGVSNLVGMRVMQDYVRQEDGSWRGKVFVPQLRRTLPSRIRLLDPGRVEIKACLFGLICKTKVWLRVS